LVEQTKGVFDPARLRVLLPTAGGPNTPGAALVVAGLAQRSANAVELMHIKAPTGWLDRIVSLFRPRPQTKEVDAEMASLRDLFVGGQPPVVRKVEHRDAALAILERARDGFDLIVLGASHRGHSLGGPVLADVIEAAPCHVLIARAATSSPHSGPYRHLLVPFDGGVFTRAAVELAVRYGEATGADVTIAMVTERRPQLLRYAGEDSNEPPTDQAPPEEDLSRISNIFRATEIRPHIVQLAYDPDSSAMNDEAVNGKYDLVVLGAENRAIQHRLFFGYDNERLISNEKVTVAIVIPNVAFLSKDDPSAMAALQRPRGTPVESVSARPAATPRDGLGG
jgi:nucleotide-binding universal stress UspA family protein